MADKNEPDSKYANVDDAALAERYREHYTETRRIEKELAGRGYEFDRRQDPIRVFKQTTTETEI